MSLTIPSKAWSTLPLLCLLAAGLTGPYRASASVPAAPTPLGPANGASVVVPFTNSWSAVLDPSGINGGYNWQVSATPNFAEVLCQNSTFPSQTQDVLSGLPNGTYYWRVQGVDNALVSGPWSATESFTVTGASSAEPVAPVLNPPLAYNTFHPLEDEYWSASTVPGAATYTFEFSTNVDFAISDPTTTKFDNLDTPNLAFAMGFEGNFFMRVRAVNASGLKSVPSNVQTFSVFFNNPIGPAPVIVSPVNNPTLTLPITFTWEDVPNPQALGYTIEIAKDSAFSNIEILDNQITGTNVIAQSLTSGQKFWRVNSTQGDASPNAGAVTAWSATGGFTIPNQTAVPVSVTIPFDPFPSGNQTLIAVQLATAPPNGAVIQMTSSDPNALPVPATITMQANIAWMQFQVQAGNVTAPEVVTVTATLNGVSASGSCTVAPPGLKSVQIIGGTAAGGSPLPIFVNLTGAAGPSGATVNLSSSSPAVSVPSTFTIQPGFFSGGPNAPTSLVTTNTPVTITATYNGVTAQAQVTLAPQAPPTSISVCPNGLPSNGSLGASGRVTIASPLPYDDTLALTCSDPTDVTINNGVTIPQGSTTGSFNVQAVPTTGTKNVTISVTGGGQTQSTTLVLNPTGSLGPTPSTLTLNPSTVVGGNSSQGTVTLSGPAPAGGAVVSLGAELTSVTVPPTVTIPAGSSSATFPINTSEVGSQTAISISAGYNCGFAFAGLTINPNGSTTGANISAFQLNPISLTGGNNSTGTVVLNNPAPNGGAVVSLSSANTSVVTVPSSVTVAAGATKANFTVRSSSVSSTTAVNLSATYRGVVAPAILTVNGSGGSGPTLSSLTLNPTSVTGGTSSRGTVTLTGAAPSGGAVVSLTSGNTSVATVPSSVTVAAGSTSATFTVSTVSVTANTSVTISGTYNGTTKSATLTVTPAPPTLASLTLNPTTVVGGNTSQGNVTLTSAAPSGGAVVSLTSGNTSVATVPSSVTVAAGSTSVTFTVSTVSVTANTSVTISGTYSGTTKNASLTVTPAASGPTLSSVGLNPGTVVGGNTSQGTVTLSGAAPSGGAVVTLSSGNTGVATVPASVTVAAGATSATFTVTSATVSANQSVTISGTYNGTTKNATLTVTPAASLVLSSLTLNPTSVSGGNNSTGTVTLSGPAPSGGAVVTLSSSDTSTATVPSSVTVSAGATSATFTVRTQRPRSTTSVTISGSYGGQNKSATLTVTGGHY